MNTAMKKLLFVFALFFGLIAPALVVSAEDLGAVRQRMSARISQIDEMKERGVVGENNRGFLEQRPGNGAADTAVIEAENRDRQTVYSALAQKTGSSEEQVAQARARHIAQNSKPGVWVQSADGSWKKK
ncbi:DUF1318 domain-containing protein [Opitutaceae bacterium EW11]|nr:DUF1318 domain-containing protein [Opitutaceae bacterium EW11]